jgi:putative ABC transport system permease protein
MLKNYFLIAWRGLLKNKLFSVINIFGLAMSMSVGVLELIRITDAFDYDTFHNDSANIYRVISNVTNPRGDTWQFASSPLPLKQAITGDNHLSTLVYPEIHSTISDASNEFDCNGAFIDPSFFKVFGFRLIYGDATSLDTPQRLLLSEKFSRKFFGKANPVGRVVSLDKLGEFEIAGVIQTPSSKSHINYDVFVSMSSVKGDQLNAWNTFRSGYTYVHVNDDGEKQMLIREIQQLQKKINSAESESSLEFELQPLASISPSPSDIYNEIGRGPTRGSLMAEIAIVFVVLIAACFNYTNLSIARALTRGKEIGIRKLSGATRFQIIAQYVMEAILISILALVVANIIVAPILEYQPFNDSYEMIPAFEMSWRFVGFVAGFTILTGVMAGILPAWLLSSFKPVRILKGVASEKLMGHLSLRKSLLVFQFSLSLIALVFLSTFYQQFDFLSHANPGFNSDGVLIVPKGMHSDVTTAFFNNTGGVRATGLTSGTFRDNLTVAVSKESSQENPVSLDYYACDKGWLDIMKLGIASGTTDLGNPGNVVINEKALTTIGFKDAEDATGSLIYLNDSTRVTISGVVKDFYSHGYGNSIKPVMFRGDSTLFRLIAVQTEGNTANLVGDLETQWMKQNPSHSFDYTWLDEEVKGDSGSATASMLGFLGIITVSIASFGLLGLVVYTVEVKRKEISIRKIIGATVQQLVALLSKGFLRLLCISGTIALPIGYLLGELFLTNFVNHISVSLPQLFLCFGLLLGIGLVTILSQTVGAANENPSRNLRSE